MTSVFGADGKNIPCTVIEAGPCVVTQLKTVEKDGYKAAQVGFMHKSEKHTNKAEAGHFKAAGVEPMRHLAEFEFDGELALGQTITAADLFEEGMYVDVIGTSKGHGFQGVVKRHGFGGVGHSRSGRPSARTGFCRCMCLPEPYFPGYPHGRTDGWRPCNSTEPRRSESNSRVQLDHGQGFRTGRKKFNRHYQQVISYGT